MILNMVLDPEAPFTCNKGIMVLNMVLDPEAEHSISQEIDCLSMLIVLHPANGRNNVSVCWPVTVIWLKDHSRPLQALPVSGHGCNQVKELACVQGAVA